MPSRIHRPAEERLANDPSSELWGEHRARYRFAAPLVAGQRVLDVACGAGFGLDMLHHAGARVIGFDLDLAALRAARSVTQTTPLARVDALALPLRNAAVDAIVSFETIEHVPDALALLSEFQRVLRPGGKLVLSTPNALFGPPELHASNPYHVREFSGEELLDLLREKFEQVTVHGQWVDGHYRHVPFLMVDRLRDPATLAWKVWHRAPYQWRERFARAWSGRSFYPSEEDYAFLPNAWAGAHALLAVASSPRSR